MSLIKVMAPIIDYANLLKTEQKISYDDYDDGYYEFGIGHDYEIKTTGDQSGTTAIIINGKTHNLSNNTVIDHATRQDGNPVEWSRYVPTANIGPATDGKLFWQQWTLAAESCTFNAATKTITAAAGTPFNTTALCVGRKIDLTDTVNNNKEVTVAAIANNVITTNEALTNEGPIDTSFATKDDLARNFIDQARINGLGGHDDWRLPNCRELSSIIDYSHSGPMIDITSFPSTPSSYHWTSTTSPVASSKAFKIGFDSGHRNDTLKKTFKCYIRLIRS